MNGCHILISLELWQRLPSVVTLWEPATEPWPGHGVGWGVQGMQQAMAGPLTA